MKQWISQHPEIKGLLWIIFTISQFVSLITFNASSTASNWLGFVGHCIGWIWYFSFGLSSFFILSGILYHAWRQISGSHKMPNKGHFVALFVAGASISLLFTLIGRSSPHLEIFAGKLLGFTSSQFHLGGLPFYGVVQRIPYVNLEKLLNIVGTACLSLVLLFFSLTYFFEISLKELLFSLFFSPKTKQKEIEKEKKPKVATTIAANIVHELEEKPAKKEKIRSLAQIDHFLNIEQDYPLEPEILAAAAQSKKKTTIQTPPKPVALGSFALPDADLLNTPKKSDTSSLVKELKIKADLLQETLLSFGIEAKVGQIHCGPTITSFEVHPAVGVKIGKIKTLDNDIALNLEAKSIRIIAPIPGKAAVGIEVPNNNPQEVSFKELLQAYQQQGANLKIPMLLGKAVNGDLVIADLTKMPHCIIAGATGSGKSVCINTIIMSILMTASPDQIRLLMIDPKKVELTPYTELPHMLAPVITEPGAACAALGWLVKEMEKRYEILKLTGQRNIDAFNKRTIDPQVEKTFHVAIPEKLTYYVAIIDELADLMMVSSSDIETPIARIAQMARAVGIHLILATQRPSREVITGLIRANFPARIAFKVASRINSQIILDETGAESLLGNGDMLFLLPGSAQLIRAQGAFIRDEEINKVIEYTRRQAPPQYLINSFDEYQLSSAYGQDEEGLKDALFDEAKSVVLSTGNASTTFLQRKLKIGYARAASLMDMLEMKGVVGPQEGSKPRKIFHPKNERLPEDAELFED
jgi:S-DNA-T family DNA segregation ATPase FtsK/SpoIIIE